MNIASGLGSATTLTLEDAEAIRTIDGVQHVAAGVRNRGWVKSAHRQFFTQLRGTGPELAEIHGWEWLGGRFEPADERAVMGRAAARELFGEGFDPVGERITIGDRAFTVSGYFRTNDPDMDETVFVMLTAGQSMWNLRHLQTITVSIDQAGDASRVAEAITLMLRDRHARGRQAASTAGLGGNQLPGGGAASVDDFTVKTQAGRTCPNSTRSRCRRCRARSAAPDRP
jgi:putative ABC transport system permease protein